MARFSMVNTMLECEGHTNSAVTRLVRQMIARGPFDALKYERLNPSRPGRVERHYEREPRHSQLTHSSLHCGATDPRIVVLFTDIREAC